MHAILENQKTLLWMERRCKTLVWIGNTNGFVERSETAFVADFGKDRFNESSQGNAQ